MFVITADQRRSRRRGDRVPEALAALTSVRPAVDLRFERTVGDEIQGAALAAAAALGSIVTLVRIGDWSIGLGIGAVESPLPASTRELRGPAPMTARTAVEHARVRNAPRISVRGEDEPGCAAVEALLRVYAAVLDGRSREAWQAIDLVREGSTHSQAAARLGITRQAVGQRLDAARYDVDEGIEDVITTMLGTVDAR